mgnify:CR=1 FL=1
MYFHELFFENYQKICDRNAFGISRILSIFIVGVVIGFIKCMNQLGNYNVMELGIGFGLIVFLRETSFEGCRLMMRWINMWGSNVMI